MKKVTDGQRYCRHHFGLVSFGPFEFTCKNGKGRAICCLTINFTPDPKLLDLLYTPQIPEPKSQNVKPRV
jgi:hypothetical protein